MIVLLTHDLAILSPCGYGDNDARCRGRRRHVLQGMATREAKCRKNFSVEMFKRLGAKIQDESGKQPCASQVLLTENEKNQRHENYRKELNQNIGCLLYTSRCV